MPVIITLNTAPGSAKLRQFYGLLSESRRWRPTDRRTSKISNLSIEYIKEYSHILDWDLLCAHHKDPVRLIELFPDKCHCNPISKNIHLPFHYAINHSDYVIWRLFVETQRPSLEKLRQIRRKEPRIIRGMWGKILEFYVKFPAFYREFADEINWPEVFSNDWELPETIPQIAIKKTRECAYFNDIIAYPSSLRVIELFNIDPDQICPLSGVMERDVSLNNIEKYKEHINLYTFCGIRKTSFTLHPKIVEMFKDDENYWLALSCMARLTEKEMIKFADRLDWTYILTHQQFSKSFLEKNLRRFPENLL